MILMGEVMTTKIPENRYKTPLKAIAGHCVDCAGSWQLAATCPMTECALHPYRFGKHPPSERPPLSEDEKSKLLARLKPKSLD